MHIGDRYLIHIFHLFLIFTFFYYFNFIFILFYYLFYFLFVFRNRTNFLQNDIFFFYISYLCSTWLLIKPFDTKSEDLLVYLKILTFFQANSALTGSIQYTMISLQHFRAGSSRCLHSWILSFPQRCPKFLCFT